MSKSWLPIRNSGGYEVSDPGGSRYWRQRRESLEHSNRKQPDKSYHDAERPYQEVAEEINEGIERFKRDHP